MVAPATEITSARVRLAEEEATLVPELMSERRDADWMTIGRSKSGLPFEAENLVTELLRAVVSLEILEMAATMDAPSARTVVARNATGKRVARRMIDLSLDVFSTCIEYFG